MTDFNIATVLEGEHLATSMSGTKPYIGEGTNSRFATTYYYLLDYNARYCLPTSSSSKCRAQL